MKPNNKKKTEKFKRKRESFRRRLFQQFAEADGSIGLDKPQGSTQGYNVIARRTLFQETSNKEGWLLLCTPNCRLRR